MPAQDLQSLVEAAVTAALAGGRVVAEGKADTSDARAKGAGDYVTAVDRESERVIAASLKESAPDIPFVGEEGGGEKAARYWLVDPLDGTTNFLHGFPIVGVSIALMQDEVPVVGVVHAPFLVETYVTSIGAGSYLRCRGRAPLPLHVAARPVEQAVVATGFPFRNKSLITRHLATLARCLERFEDLRRPGAASLDLAWVAAGVFDGFFELGLSSWDVAAGALLVQEAGGFVSDWSGGTDYMTGNILAGPRQVHEELVRIAALSEADPGSPAGG